MTDSIIANLESELGAVPPPPGVTADFTTRTALSDQIVVVSGVCLAVSTPFVLLRMYTRLYLVRTFALEDFCALLAWLGAVAVAVIHIVLSYHGFGRHLWDVTISEFFVYGRLGLSYLAIYFAEVSLAKVTLLLLFHRLATTAWQRKVFLGVMIFIILYTIAMFFALIFSCHPVAYFWDLTISGGYCVNRTAILIFMAVMNVLTNFVILLLPVPLIWRLRLSRGGKAGVTVMFLVGLLDCAVSIVLVQTTIPPLITAPVIGPFGATDVTYNLVLPGYWIAAEMHLSVICCCLPALGPFFSRYFPSVFGSTVSPTTSRSADLSGPRGRPDRWWSRKKGPVVMARKVEENETPDRRESWQQLRGSPGDVELGRWAGATSPPPPGTYGTYHAMEK
ncbi:MAG: hypothetical protein M1838_001472 [Thelocarpon superellum]|nr:MAG: hypothetical protein M1838_001472 [Thelocarpon superellum]